MIGQKETNCLNNNNVRKISPLELISEDKKDETSELNKQIKETIEKLLKFEKYRNIINGSKLGHSAYLKPNSGIPYSDLSSDLLILLSSIKSFINSESPYGKAIYNKSDNKVYLYSKDDLTSVRGTIDVKDLILLLKGEKGDKGDKGPKGDPGAGFTSEEKEIFKLEIIDAIINFEGASQAIDTINEIYQFLDGIKDTDSLIQKLTTLQSEINNKISLADLASVATSGDFNDLDNKPTIDTILSKISTNAVLNKTITEALLNKPDLTDVLLKSEYVSGSGTLLENKMPQSVIDCINSPKSEQSDWNEVNINSQAFIKNKPDIPTQLRQLQSDSTHRIVTDAEKSSWNNKLNALTFDNVPTENSNNPVKSSGVFDALTEKVNIPANTVYVTRAYWTEKGVDTFTQDNTHYILVEDLYDLPNDAKRRVFGKNCVLSAHKGCRFGQCYITLTDTYINVGQQELFRGGTYYGSSGTVRGTYIYGSFGNGRILVEWWGAKGGKGVYSNGSYENAATEAQAFKNALAFNDALYFAGKSEVYAPASMYLIGMSIYDASSQSLTGGIENDDDNIPRSFTKLYIEGDLVASNEFRGRYRSAPHPFTWVEVPAIVYLNGNLPRCIIRGSVVVPFSAQDKEIVIGNVPETLTDADVGKIYFVANTYSYTGDTTTYNRYDVWDIYYHYTSETDSTKEVAKRKIGCFNTTSALLTNYKNTSNKYGGCNGKMPGMYGLSVSSIGGLIEVGRIIKGDLRAGYWNLTKDNKLASYRYRKEVMHQGQCTALGLRCVKSTTIKIGQIEGFNDGVAFDGTHSPVYDGVEFNRFEIGSIACNHAVHGTVGDSCYACLVDKDKSTAYYFDSCRWILGGFEHFAAGNNGLHCFCPTTSKSTYFLVEWAGNSHTGGFSCHWVEWNTAPLRWYTSIIDIAHAKDNQFIMHGNSSGDTGRVVLWLTEENIRTNLSGIWSKLDGVQTVEGETNAMFPYDSFVGIESLSKRPYAYADLAAMSNPASTWLTTTEYSYDGRLAPYSGSTLLYSEWACPYSSTRSYINFRTGSYHNVVRGGRDHMLCYNSVYSDSQSGMNELRHCQSAQAMFVEGNYTVFNANHPVFDIVRFDRDNDPRNHHNSSTHVEEGGDKRVMFVPDENTLSCLQAVDAVADISANGLYIIKGLSDTSDSSGSYKQTRYQLYERYGSGTNVQVGWISGIFLSLIESGGGSVDLSGYYTKTEIDNKGYLTQHQDISGKADKVTVVEVDDTGDVTQALDANKFYKFTVALTSLTLTLNASTGFAMYAGKFTTGSGWGSNGLSIPATVTEAANNDEIEASKTYEFSIMDNVIVVKEV